MLVIHTFTFAKTISDYGFGRVLFHLPPSPLLYMGLELICTVATNLVLIIPQHKEDPLLKILAAIPNYEKGNVNLRKPVWVYVCWIFVKSCSEICPQ